MYPSLYRSSYGDLRIGGRFLLPATLLVTALWGCSGAAPERPAGAPDAGVFTEPVIVFATAGAEDLDAARSEMGDDDFYAMADDLMWYRAMADELLADQDVPVERVEGRSELLFLVDGEAQHRGFPEIPTLDLIVLYRPGAEPLAVPPIELSADPGLVARYFASPAGAASGG